MVEGVPDGWCVGPKPGVMVVMVVMRIVMKEVVFEGMERFPGDSLEGSTRQRLLEVKTKSPLYKL